MTQYQQPSDILSRQWRAIAHIQGDFLADKTPSQIFDELLQALLDVTDSEYGFIGEVRRDEKTNAPYLKTFALTNIAWNEDTLRFYEENAPNGLEFYNLNSLFGGVMVTQTYVIANDPANDPRRCGLPEGHPPLNAFFGFPLRFAGEMVGMGGISNRPGGYEADFTETFSPMINACANILGAYINDRGRREIEARLREAKELAEKASLAKSSFLANMSHELRTPLNGVIGGTALLRKSGLDAEQAEYVDIIESSSRALSSLVADVLDLSRIEAGEATLDAEPFRLSDLLSEIEQIFRVEVERKQLALCLQDDTGLHEGLFGDAVRLRQVVINLVSNAIKFTDHGGVTVTARYRREEPEGRLEFLVEDSGIGLPDAVDRLFEKFTQGDASTTRRYGGTGLGLAICRSIVRLMNGTIDGWNRPEGGSCFRVIVPMPTTRTEREPTSRPGDEVPRGMSPRPGLRVLVAEDNAINQKVIMRLLERLHCNVTLARDGAEAIACLDQDDFDLVFMDVQMPVMDGLTALQRIRARADARASIPVIALTASAMVGDREKLLDAGMDGYLAKPVAEAGLIDVLLRFAGPLQ